MQGFLSTLAVVAIVMLAGAAADAQIRVRTEIVRPPTPPAAPSVETRSDVTVTGDIPPPAPEVITDLGRLPPAVARTRKRILAAARTGRLDALVAVMHSNEPMPIFSLDDEKDPLAYWRRDYPDSGGIEILAILSEILEAGFVHVDQGAPEEMYVWPYFARAPLKTLTPEQKVDLFKIVTGSDYRNMVKAGAYNFFRIGIGRDGAWRFFVAGN